jgi:hypothetical protein
MHQHNVYNFNRYDLISGGLIIVSPTSLLGTINLTNSMLSVQVYGILHTVLCVLDKNWLVILSCRTNGGDIVIAHLI